MGIDIHDKEESKKIQKLKDINEKNKDLIGDCSKNIVKIHKSHGEILQQIDVTQGKISEVLQKKRTKIFETFDEKINEMKEQIRKEEEKNKDKQYDYK